MIIDCFMFANELDILEGRLQYLYDRIDKFVIVESNLTFSGKTKPFNYLENQERLVAYSDKIQYVKFTPDRTKYDFDKKLTEFDYSSGYWRFENDQRGAITEALKDYPDDALVVISDLDEIPSRNLIDITKKHLTPDVGAVVSFQDMFYFNLQHKELDQWRGTVITFNKYVQSNGAQWFRDNRFKLRGVLDSGWHLSYWGDPAFIQAKIINSAHQEYNNARYTDIDYIKQVVSEGKDLYGRDLKFVRVDATTLPKDFLECFGKFEVTL